MNVNAKFDRAAGIAVIGLCVYETAAMMSGRPTVSALCRRYRACEAALLVILLTHLHYERKREDELAQAVESYNLLRDLHLAYQRYLMRGRPEGIITDVTSLLGRLHRRERATARHVRLRGVLRRAI